MSKLVDNSKILLKRLSQRFAYSHGTTICSYDPVIFGVELTNYCNLRCLYCLREPVIARGLRYMSTEQFKFIVQHYAKLMGPEVQLHHHGETFLHPDFSDLMAIVREYHLQAKIVTNGTLVMGQKAKDAISSLKHIVFSFDAPTPDYFENLRAGAKYRICEQNIINFCRENNEAGHPVQVWISLALSSEVKKYFFPFLERWANMVDAIYFCQLIDWSGTKLDQASKLGNVRNVGRRFRCGFPWSGFYIMVNGDVYPCCEWEPNPASSMGNVFTKPIDQIWNGPQYQRFREKHTSGDLSGLYCEHCHEPWTAGINIEKIKRPVLGYKTWLFIEFLSWIKNRTLKKCILPTEIQSQKKYSADIYIQTDASTPDGRGYTKNNLEVPE